MHKSKIPTKLKEKSPSRGPKPLEDAPRPELAPTFLYKYQEKSEPVKVVDEPPVLQEVPSPIPLQKLNRTVEVKPKRGIPLPIKKKAFQKSEADLLVLHQPQPLQNGNYERNETLRTDIVPDNLETLADISEPILDAVNSSDFKFPRANRLLPGFDNDSLLPLTEFSRQTLNSPISWLSDKLLKKIFSYLHPAELGICRTVGKYWNALICQDEYFIENTVYVVNMIKTFNEATQVVSHSDVTAYTWLPFQHARFQCMDHRFLKEPTKFIYRNSDNEKYFPSTKFLQSLVSIEFRSCFLLWKTIKALLIQAVQVISLKIHNCHISDYAPASSTSINEFDEFNAGNAIFGLKTLEVYEMRSLDNITSVLKKFSGYTNQGLTTLKISFHPPATRKGSADQDRALAMDFCRELKAVIALCANSLKILHLDIQHEITLDMVGFHVSKELAALGGRMDLKEFLLTPGLDCWMLKPELMPSPSVVMSLRSFNKSTRELQTSMKVAASSLIQFLQSQKDLEVLGLPYMEYPETNTFFKMVMGKLKCAASLKYLAVPSSGFIPRDVFKYFPNLKKVKVGVSCCQEITPGWDIFRHYTKNAIEQSRLESVPEVEDNLAPGTPREDQLKLAEKKDLELEKLVPGLKLMKGMEQVSISSAIQPDNFELTAKYLCNLSSLEINSGFENPVVSDDELQIIIKKLTKLRNLLISSAEKLTDYGLTGIPSRLCKLMFNNQRYHKDGIRKGIWNSDRVKGRPLSDLRGLRKLILMGKCEVTDIGIGYGLAFTELRHCHLPYSDYITDWGIEKFGERNPSLDTLAFSGVNQYNKDAFIKLRRSHYRIKRGDPSRCGYFEERKSQFTDNFILGLPSMDELAEGYAYIARLVQNVAAFLIRPITMEFS